jgi:hypothetical protein
MATQLFRDGETTYVHPKNIQRHLDDGWSFDDPDLPHSPAHIGTLSIPPGASEAKAEHLALQAMGIVPEIEIGAMHVPV